MLWYWLLILCICLFGSVALVSLLFGGLDYWLVFDVFYLEFCFYSGCFRLGVWVAGDFAV